MPGWNIHLEVGERIAKHLKISGKQKDEFLLGCLLPDINNGYINKVKVQLAHAETHWAFDEKSSLNFYAKYKKEIDAREPIYLGYLVHLYTDGYFNYHFYHHIKRTAIGENLDHDAKQKIKHNDFWIYDAKYIDRNLNVRDKAEAVLKANKINRVNVDESELCDVEEIIASNMYSKLVKGKKYIFYTEKWLDELMDEMIESFAVKYLDKREDAGTTRS